MKTISTILVLASISMFSNISHALVREMATCQTADKQYQVTVMDNEGIGPVRTPHYGATIYNAEGEVLASYSVESNAGQPRSISFGQDMYFDEQTKGQEFKLAFGSTNFRHITLVAVLDNGTKLSETDLVCQNFGL